MSLNIIQQRQIQAKSCIDLCCCYMKYLCVTSLSLSFLLFCPSTDCLLGPVDEDLKKDREMEGVSPLHMPPALSHSHPNAFHVWDQDDVIIPMTPPNESPLTSPLMAVIPYIPSFFPTSLSIASPSHNQPIPKESDTWGKGSKTVFIWRIFNVSFSPFLTLVSSSLVEL